MIIVLFQLYQACAVTRRGENGYSEVDKVNTTSFFKKKVVARRHSMPEKGNNILISQGSQYFFFLLFNYIFYEPIYSLFQF